MHRRPRALALLLVLLLVLGAACGGDDADDGAEPGDAPETTSSTAPPDEEEPVEEEPDEEEPASDGALPAACDLVDPAALPDGLAAVTPEADDDTAIDGLDYSQCTWESEDVLLVVAVIDGPARYEMHAENLPGEPLSGVGDEAITAPGISSETRGGSGGRTVSALVGDRTLVVALRLEGETTPDDVVPLATAAVDRMG